MSLLQPTNQVDLTRRVDKRLARLERRANLTGQVSGLSRLDGLGNRVVNGSFRTNQPQYVSGATALPGDYLMDMWRCSGYTNLASANPSFETNTTGWSAVNATLTRVNTWSADGLWSLQISAPTTNDSAATFVTLVTIPGATYTVSATARLTAPLTGTAHARARAIYVNDGTSQIGLSPALPNVAGQGRLSVTFVATNNATSIRLYNGHTGGTIWWDAFMVTRTSTLKPYTAQYSNIGAELTFTADADFGQTVTLGSGEQVHQIMERSRIPAGTYTFAHDGTAQMRVYNVGAAAPAYAASPVTVALDGTADVIVEFYANGGASKTIAEVRGDVGTTDPGWRLPLIGDELRACQRYYYRVSHPAGSPAAKPLMMVSFFTTTFLYGVWWHPQKMRDTPVMRFSAATALSVFYAGSAVASTGVSASQVDTTSGRFQITVASAGTANTGTWVELAAGQYLEADGRSYV